MYSHFYPIAVSSRYYTVITVNLSFSTPDRDRPVSVTKLWSQISHANRTLFTVTLILNKSTGLKLTINVSLIASENI